jgi:predicted RND superfamily exporter protein
LQTTRPRSCLAGNKLVEISSEDDASIITAQKFGLTPKVLSDLRTMGQFNKKTEEDYRETVSAIVEVANRYYGNEEMLTNENLQTMMQDEINLIVYMGKYKDEEKKIIMRRVDEKLAKQEYKFSEEFEKALDHMYNKEGTAALQGVGALVEGKE